MFSCVLMLVPRPRAGPDFVGRARARRERQPHPGRQRRVAAQRDQEGAEGRRRQVHRPQLHDPLGADHLCRPHLLQGAPRTRASLNISDCAPQSTHRAGNAMWPFSRACERCDRSVQEWVEVVPSCCAVKHGWMHTVAPVRAFQDALSVVPLEAPLYHLRWRRCWHTTPCTPPLRATPA